jgi:hypothetical protein
MKSNDDLWAAVGGCNLRLFCDAAFFRAAVAVVLQVLEDEAAKLPKVQVTLTVANLAEPGFFCCSYPKGSSTTFSCVPSGSLAWEAVMPLMGGIASAYRSSRSVSSESDQVSSLLLDRRLVRMRGGLVSSWMTGALVAFL